MVGIKGSGKKRTQDESMNIGDRIWINKDKKMWVDKEKGEVKII